jgi:hypothetical protein
VRFIGYWKQLVIKQRTHICKYIQVPGSTSLTTSYTTWGRRINILCFFQDTRKVRDPQTPLIYMCFWEIVGLFNAYLATEAGKHVPVQDGQIL